MMLRELAESICSKTCSIPMSVSVVFSKKLWTAGSFHFTELGPLDRRLSISFGSRGGTDSPRRIKILDHLWGFIRSSISIVLIAPSHLG